MKKLVACALAGMLTVSVLGSVAGKNVYAEDGKTVYVASHQITVHTESETDSPSEMIPYRTALIDTGNSYGTWKELNYNGKTVWWYPSNGELKESLPETNYTGNNKYQTKALSIAKKIYTEWKTGYGHNASDGKVHSDGKYYFDCSGFVSYVMDHAMQSELPVYNISADIAELYKTKNIYNKGFAGECKVKTVCEGTLDEDKLQPGDVLFFTINDKDGKCDHCGLYLGNGEMMHSTHNFGGSVRLMPIHGFYDQVDKDRDINRFIAAKRYLPTAVKAANKKAYAAASTTTIYKNFGENAKKLTSIRLMKPLTVLYTDNGNWAYVKLANGKKGFTLLDNICTNLEGKGISCTVRNNGLKLFTKKSQSAKSITLNKGKKVSLRGQSGNYYKVKYNGKYYYIYTPKSIADKLTTY
ncbi:Cell wall-associated hydrolase, NlpC family [Lachnospiraceae bacterium XBB1006]|nr:Cell wall-associated hydrolase, NlpC family [Lachnospiraceae bacterium XBB1006]